METASAERAVNRAADPVVVCITDTPEERRRLAGLFDGVGVLVMASDADSASTFLGHLQDTSPAPADDLSREGVVHAAGLHLDVAHHEATWQGQSLPLTSYELRVLGYLASGPGRVWTYEQLHDHVWGGTYFSGPAAVQSVIKRLRAKLRQAGVPLRIDAVRGVGFRLVKGPELHLVTPLPTG